MGFVGLEPKSKGFRVEVRGLERVRAGSEAGRYPRRTGNRSGRGAARYGIESGEHPCPPEIWLSSSDASAKLKLCRGRSRR